MAEEGAIPKTSLLYLFSIAYESIYVDPIINSFSDVVINMEF